MTAKYKPEGSLIHTKDNRFSMACRQALDYTMQEGKILEGTVFLCDADFNLHVDLCGFKGIIPKDEVSFIFSGEQQKDIAIVSRVGKPVCFKILSCQCDDKGAFFYYLSRREAQAECLRNYLDLLQSGDIIDARVTHMEHFGAFCDVGCGIAALLSIDCISVSRISHPSDRFRTGDSIRAVVKSRDDFGRLCLTHRELLGSWEENAAAFEIGQTVSGTVRSIESYGIFVELTPNLAGLAECREDVSVGQTVAVYIKSIVPEKMKIKLVLINGTDDPPLITTPRYFTGIEKREHIDCWRYSPPGCKRIIETVFN